MTREYLYVGLAVVFTAISQISMKRGMNEIGSLPGELQLVLPYLGKILQNLNVLSGILFGLIAAISWLSALPKVQLSYAYPILSLTFVLVALLSALVFKEEISLMQWLGIAVIIFGIYLVSRGSSLWN
ncbi:EamA family transporter [Candidatus Acetothermia bacterium]|nr:EamA family transporter [Candidatus Acetothermia bacterium]MBI3643973.1 EamA family transporter [Candidatus Acetothermia bacterium]